MRTSSTIVFTVLSLALFALTAAMPACTIAPRDNKNDLNANAGTALPAAPPPVAVAPVAPPAAPAPVAAPAPPPPVQTVVVKTVATADPVGVCRSRFTRECTGACNEKVNQTTTGSQRRIAHDICFGECTRAAFKRCK